MPELQLRQNEKYIRHCATVFFNEKAFPPKGTLYFTNQRIVFHQVSLARYLFFGFLSPERLTGKFAFAIALGDIADIRQAKRHGKKDVMEITLRDSRKYTFAVDSFERRYDDIKPALAA